MVKTATAFRIVIAPLDKARPSDENIQTEFKYVLEAQMRCFQDNMKEAYNLLSIGIFLGLYLTDTLGTCQGESALQQATALVKSCKHVLAWKNSGFPYFNDASDTGIAAAQLATLMLSILLTDTTLPDAMGYKGIPHQIKPANTYQSGQQDPSGKDLCVDHSAMLFPTPDFMKYVYKRDLMHTSGLAFKKFGVWPGIGT